MNYLGIDYGTRRIGLAKADDETRIAIPLKAIENTKNVVGDLADIVGLEDIGEIIVGVPISFDGQEHGFAKETRRFGDMLASRFEMPVHFQNEILTSAQASRSGSRDIDASAAALILQEYLDRK